MIKPIKLCRKICDFIFYAHEVQKYEEKLIIRSKLKTTGSTDKQHKLIESIINPLIIKHMYNVSSIQIISGNHLESSN